jgi:hypothetical protein
MSCPVCQSKTVLNNVYCSSDCAKLILAAVKEAASTKPRVVPSTTPSKKQTYEELRKQSQMKAASMTVTNKCSADTCTNQTVGNNLYCSTCSTEPTDNVVDTKCMKCKTNERNGKHPICSECHKTLKPRRKKPSTKSVDETITV